MPPIGRSCSECSASLAGRAPDAKTCSEKCRQKRSRRLKRANRQIREIEEHQGAGAAEIAAIVRRESPDVIKNVMKEQLGPVVREALTEDVLRAVEQMLGLTPRAVELLQQDLESDDATIRQRAYTLVTKYTIGHPALLKSEDTEPNKQLVVNFNLPRPDAEDVAPEVAEATEIKTCDMCGEDKPAPEFVAGSLRCESCFVKWQESIRAQFA